MHTLFELTNNHYFWNSLIVVYVDRYSLSTPPSIRGNVVYSCIVSTVSIECTSLRSSCCSWYISSSSLSVIGFSHSPLHKQSSVHGNFSILQRHLTLHRPFGAHLHLISCLHAFDASGKGVQSGTSFELSSFHPHIMVSGSSGDGIMVLPHMCPAWYAARFVCSMSAAWVGEILSTCFLPETWTTWLCCLSLTEIRSNFSEPSSLVGQSFHN